MRSYGTFHFGNAGVYFGQFQQQAGGAALPLHRIAPVLQVRQAAVYRPALLVQVTY